MTPERFSELLDAYGSDLQRWPEAERAPGRALLEQGPPELRRQLAAATALDSWLDAHAVAAPDDLLVRRIVASAAPSKAPAATRGPRWLLPRWVWPGAGVAGIGLAGMAAGVFAVSIALHGMGPGTGTGADRYDRGTAFGEVSADWNEE